MRPKLIVAGPLAAKPGNAGGVWERFSYAVGFERLGFDVAFLEQLPEPPSPAAREWFEAGTGFFGFRRRAFLVDSAGRSWDGDGDLERFVSEAVLLVNLGGNLTAAAILDRVACTAFVDVDPGFTQSWHADAAIPYELPRHDHFFTIGENIGRPGCPIPTGGLDWKPTRQPVLLHLWPVMPPVACRRFTTIASWRGAFGGVAINGIPCGQKVHEFRRMIELPRRIDEAVELALEIHPGDVRDREALLAAGWRLVSPADAVPTPGDFRRYIQESDAEFSVAQGVYVSGRSGWFSDRSTRYLACGRPVLVQDTDLREIPTGEGVVTFDSLESAVEGARCIAADYPRQCRAARDLAERFFAADLVLGQLLAAVGLDRPRAVG